MDLTVNPYRYCGEYQDETTELYYLRARYYDSTTGRFISADSYPGSTADPVSLHKYLYANANPVMNSDPTGYFTLYGMTAAIKDSNNNDRTVYCEPTEQMCNGIRDAFINSVREHF